MPAVIDSSGWIEFFTDGPNSDSFADVLESADELVVPSITITEVYRWMLREASLSHALVAAAAMMQGEVVALGDRLAVIAAELSHRHRLRLADGIIYAASRDRGAELHTQDAHFEGLPDVVYIEHPERKDRKD